MKKQIVIGLYGVTLDRSSAKTTRWQRWRPSLSLLHHEDLQVDEFVLLVQPQFMRSARRLAEDMQQVSSDTRITLQPVEVEDVWDFEQMYAALYDVASQHPFDTAHNDYLIHITTGSHVAQICLFLLTETRYFPGRLIQSSPGKGADKPIGTYRIIDLNLGKYDQLAARFRRTQLQGQDLLKSGIDTRNAVFNRMIEEIEQVAIKSRDPILLSGATGVGKSQLAQRIHQLKRQRQGVSGAFVEVNCATITGDGAMSALFGHARGAFTGADRTREGFLRAADKGVLFLDEIGELGLDEQAMLLRAIEDKRFHPMGSDQEAASDFQLIAGTNRDLNARVSEGRFRDDLLARINFWPYHLPGLADRREDIMPNVTDQLAQLSDELSIHLTFNTRALERFKQFALDPATPWSGNFRDLNAALKRMAILADGGRIREADVGLEIDRLKQSWCPSGSLDQAVDLMDYLPESMLSEMDRFDCMQLGQVIACCLESRSMADAGRQLFNVSRLRKRSSNDSHRLRTYLNKFGLTWSDIHPPS